ncbi:MAG: methyltransferase domain-containing protein [Patescibacteria group bacterium]
MPDKYKKIFLFGFSFFITALFFIITRFWGEGGFLWSSDAEGYRDIFLNLINHKGFFHDVSWGPQALRTPFYPIFSALFYLIFPKIYFIIFIQVILSAVTVVTVYGLGKMIFGEKAGFIAAILYALESQRLQVANQLMSETLFVFLFILSLYFLFYFLLKNQKNIFVLLSGLCFGLALLTKPIIQILPVLMLGFLLWQANRSGQWKKYAIAAIIFILAAFAVVSPWLVRNKIHFGQFKLSSAGGINLYYANSTHFAEYLSKKAGNRQEFYDEFTKLAISDLGEEINLSDWRKESLRLMEFKYEKYFTEKSLELIKGHPLDYTAFHLKRMAVFFIESSASRSFGAMLRGAHLPEKIFYPFLYWGGRFIWASFLLISLAIYFLKRRRVKNTAIPIFLFLTILYFAALSAPNWDIPRMREPVAPLMFLLFANSLMLLGGDRKKDVNLEDVYRQVPPDYWDTSYKNNILQRVWYILRFRILKRILKQVPDGANILDVGCGSGFSMEKSIPPGKKFNVYGIDVTEDVILYAKNKRPAFHFQVAYGENLPFENNFFDVVFYLDVIEHLKNPVESLREARRALKPGGVAVILVAKEHHPLFRVIWWIWKKMKGMVWEDAHLHIFDEKNLKKTISDAGLEMQKMHKIHLGMSLVAVAKKHL